MKLEGSGRKEKQGNGVSWLDWIGVVGWFNMTLEGNMMARARLVLKTLLPPWRYSTVLLPSSTVVKCTNYHSPLFPRFPCVCVLFANWKCNHIKHSRRAAEQGKAKAKARPRIVE